MNKGDGFREGLNPSYARDPPDGQITDFLSSPSAKNIPVPA
jgi:hypothetical protein